MEQGGKLKWLENCGKLMEIDGDGWKMDGSGWNKMKHRWKEKLVNSTEDWWKMVEIEMDGAWS